MARPKKVALGTFARLTELFSQMEIAYEKNAKQSNLTCTGCSNNCCSSYFRHHTYIEWIYLLKGLQLLEKSTQEAIKKRAALYKDHMDSVLPLGQIPNSLCPLNVEGKCILYSHRLMICRMHGTKNICHMPNGQVQHFPGCWRFVEQNNQKGINPDDVTALDRTPFYKELAKLEQEILKKAKHSLPRVNLTIAEMILSGVPPLR